MKNEGSREVICFYRIEDKDKKLDIYESNWGALSMQADVGCRNTDCSSGGRFRAYCDSERNPQNDEDKRGRASTDNIDTNRQILHCDT